MIYPGATKAERREGRAIRVVVIAIVFLALVLPILAGIMETAMAALGNLAAIGATGPSLVPLRMVLDLPGIGTSIFLSLWTGVAATACSSAIAVGIAAALHGKTGLGRLQGRLSPILATPHAALAIGLAFLLAPSGWIARLVATGHGWTTPPDLATVHDPLGLALILGLVIKETPFLLLVLLGAIGQDAIRLNLRSARTLGYSTFALWLKIVLPLAYPLIRLPVFAVLAFSLSVVDMAIILGPSNPPTLSVLGTRLFLSSDAQQILPASVIAILQAMLVLSLLGFCLIAERAIAHPGLRWAEQGGRGGPSACASLLVRGACKLLVLLTGLALLLLLVWSFAWRWTFPQLMPESWSLSAWMEPATGWAGAALATFSVAGASTILSLALAILWLEGEDCGHFSRARWAELLIYLPLLLPQLAFLYGLNVVALRLGIGGGLLGVIWAHCLFVFPYIMVALSDPWRALDPRLSKAAAALGAGQVRRLVSVKLPCLLGPILTAAAIGFAVSVAQYLPTLFLGAGRVATLTTEAVTLSSGSDRRIVGVFAVLQAVLPFLAYLTALALPAVLFRNRRGLRMAR